jgi:hypothetical protein
MPPTRKTSAIRDTSRAVADPSTGPALREPRSSTGIGSAGHDVGPHLAVLRDRLWGWAALPLGGGAMAVGERLRAEPGLERLLVAPAGDHQPLLPVVGGLQQLEPLEAVGVVDGPGSGREPLSSSPDSCGTVIALILMTVMTPCCQPRHHEPCLDVTCSAVSMMERLATSRQLPSSSRCQR